MKYIVTVRYSDKCRSQFAIPNTYITQILTYADRHYSCCVYKIEVCDNARKYISMLTAKLSQLSKISILYLQKVVKHIIRRLL